MILLFSIVLGIALSLALRRDLLALARVHFRWPWLVPLGLALQILLFSQSWRRLPNADALWPLCYTMSMCLVAAFCVANWRVPGIPLLTLGLLLNGAAIVANGGAMPASLEALRLAGLALTSDEVAVAVGSNSVLATPGTPLWFLGDIWAIPAHWPLSNVYSPGDVILGLGGLVFIYLNAAPQPSE